jgi:hypothetical protein
LVELRNVFDDVASNAAVDRNSKSNGRSVGVCAEDQTAGHRKNGVTGCHNRGHDAELGWEEKFDSALSASGDVILDDSDSISAG